MIKNNSHILDYSILILLEGKREGFADFVNCLQKTLKKHSENFEIIILANGTESFFRSQIKFITSMKANIKAFSFHYKTTQAVCLKAGFKESHGQKIVVCGDYQQITEESFLRLIHALDDEVDIVCPWRQRRVDPKINQMQSRLFNWLVKIMLGTRINDLSSTVRVFYRKVLDSVNLYGNMYRFLPVLAEQKGFKCKEVKCDHLDERGKTGIYKMNEYIVRIIDILTIYFNTKFIRKPLRFFMSLGSVFIGSSFLIGAYICVKKIFFSYSIGGSPLLLLSVFLLAIGIQITGVGLLGEIITFTIGRKKFDYNIKCTVNFDRDDMAQ